MKIICFKEHQAILEKKLISYENLDITIVENGCEYEGMGYHFNYDNLSGLINYLDNLLQRDCLVVYKQNIAIRMPYSKIHYIEAVNKDCYIHCGEDEYQTKETLGQLEEKLKSNQFARISKSIIVNLRHVDYMIPLANMHLGLYLPEHVRLFVSRKYLKDFKKKVGL